MNNLETLRMRALALRSSVHNEHCLSAIELCGMVAKKTNELIDVVNDVCEFVNSLTVEGNVKYDETTESLIIGGIE